MFWAFSFSTNEHVFSSICLLRTLPSDTSLHTSTVLNFLCHARKGSNRKFDPDFELDPTTSLCSWENLRLQQRKDLFWRHRLRRVAFKQDCLPVIKSCTQDLVLGAKTQYCSVVDSTVVDLVGFGGILTQRMQWAQHQPHSCCHRDHRNSAQAANDETLTGWMQFKWL